MLHWHWGDKGPRWLAKRLNRSPEAITARARTLGLDAVQGHWITLRQAVDILGLSPNPAAALLHAQHNRSAGRGGIRRQLSESAQRREQKRGHVRYHREDVVRFAERYWTERRDLMTVEEAARELGVCGATVKAALVRAGHEPPGQHRKWHVKLEAARAALEAHLSKSKRGQKVPKTQSVKVVARCIGTPPGRLRKALLAAGLPTAGPVDVERARALIEEWNAKPWVQECILRWQRSQARKGLR